MKKWLFILIFLILVTAVHAEVQDTAIVTINIINQPPRITALSFSPIPAYEDSVLECKPDIVDEAPDNVEVEYKWYNNGVYFADAKKVDGFEEDDQLTCVAKPVDSLGLEGETVVRTIRIQKTPFATKAVMFVMGTLGVESNAQNTLALQQQGLGSITGYVVSEMTIASSLMPLLLFLILLIVLVNINLAMRYLIRKRTVS